MDGKVLARIGAVVFVAIAITATVIDRARQDEPPRATTWPALQPPTDPLRVTLRRCQHLGENARLEPLCLSAWSEARDRFLGRPTTPVGPRWHEGP